jgi:hypothetical protein
MTAPGAIRPALDARDQYLLDTVRVAAFDDLCPEAVIPLSAKDRHFGIAP